MSNETDTTTRKPLKLSSPGKLELKKTVDGGQVRQSFPHGRTKTVAVEVKKKRTYTQGAGSRGQQLARRTAVQGDQASHASVRARFAPRRPCFRSYFTYSPVLILEGLGKVEQHDRS